jgi:hypothetical protein
MEYISADYDKSGNDARDEVLEIILLKVYVIETEFQTISSKPILRLD